MSLYLNGNIIKGSLVIDGEAFYKATILEGSASTDKWAEPLVYNSVNVLDYEVLCFKGTDQGVAFNLYYKIADLPISADPVSDNDYTQFSTNGYLYVDANGYLYFCVTSTRTLVLNEIVAYSGKEQPSGRELPYVVYCSCINCSQIRTITFTATENGVYQLYLFWTTSDTPSTTNIDVKLNGVDVTLTFALTGRGYAYTEIELSVGDVLTISNTYIDSNRGIIATITQNADISNYALIGEEGNSGNTFPIGSGKFVLEWYQYSFYSGASRYNYMIVADAPTSIATPSGSSSYYYGGTSAIQL